MAVKSKVTLMIVEDDEVLLRALYLLFLKNKYIIASATDGQSALQIVERLIPDLIILDLLLPKLNGFEFLRITKANPKLKHIPVVVLSNLGDAADVEKAKTLGAEDYFIKAETDLATLEKKITEILKNRSQ